MVSRRDRAMARTHKFCSIVLDPVHASHALMQRSGFQHLFCYVLPKRGPMHTAVCISSLLSELIQKD